MPYRNTQIATNPPARRVVVLVLDGLRADLVGDARFPNLLALRDSSAYSLDATTVLPSVTAVAMTSLLSGVTPSDHGVVSDRFRVPDDSRALQTVPHLISRAGLPTFGVVQQVPSLLRPLAKRIVRALGLDTVQFGQSNAHAHHDSAHPFDCAIPIFLDGAGILPQHLAGGLTLLDVPATVLWALGMPVPDRYAGTPIRDAFMSAVQAPIPATAA